MPDRSELMGFLAPVLATLPKPQRVVLHYLNGRVEAEVFLPYEALADAAVVSAAERESPSVCASIPCSARCRSTTASAFCPPAAADFRLRAALGRGL
jgi:hypothetical protein